MNTRRLLSLLARARRMGPRRAIARLRPVRIDELLFELRPGSSSAQAGNLAGLTVQRFDAQHPSPWPQINARLSPARAVYVAADGKALAHQSWVLSDVVNPAAFGFDPATPVIGECETGSAFRGRGIYPHMLRYITEDLERREGLQMVYITVAPDNTASIRGIEKAGARRLAHLRGWRLMTFGWPRPRPHGQR